jgi:hypothetical protein
VNIVDHFHELVPPEGSAIGLITLQNGICTSKKDLIQNMRSLANMVPEATLTFGSIDDPLSRYWRLKMPLDFIGF